MAKSNYDIYMESLEKKRAPAVTKAIELIAQERYDEAEQTIKSVDNSIYGAVATAKVYRQRLEELVTGGLSGPNKTRAEAVFWRALSWAQSAYPEPHTAIEAENYSDGRSEDYSELVKILGYEPQKS
jgi:hypothetical protein